MSVVVFGLQVALAIVLAIAGVAKLVDLAGSRKAVREFGIPERFTASIGTLLPIAELLIAATLLPSATAHWTAIAAGSLFTVFALAVGVNLLHGRQPDCHCFGQLRSSPAGWTTVGRNVLLAIGAAVVAWRGGQGPPSQITDVAVRDLVLLLIGFSLLGVVLAQAWLMVNLWRQNGRLLLRVEALEQESTTVQGQALHQTVAVSRPAPEFDLPLIDGGRLALRDVRQANKPTLLVFSDPKCGPCNQLLPDLGRWSREHKERLQIAVVSSGSLEANRDKSQKHGLSIVAIQTDREVAQAYGVYGTPAAVLVHPDGIIRDPVATGADAIRALVGRVTKADRPSIIPLREIVDENGSQRRPGHHSANRLEIGDQLPPVALPTVDGSTVRLDGLRSRETVMLFWNPACGFCQRMLPDLQGWEHARPDTVPDLLIVSTGSAAANRDMDLRSTVLLDEGFSVGRVFGASGTPSAVLVDTEGRMASSPHVGADAVMGLLFTMPQHAGNSAHSAD